MSMDNVTIEFNPPCTYKQVKKSYWLESNGESIQLPVAQTKLTLEQTPEGDVVTSVSIPRFIAEDRGLSEPEKQAVEPLASMTRHDWFRLGSLMALLIRGETITGAMWEANKIADNIAKDE